MSSRTRPDFESPPAKRQRRTPPPSTTMAEPEAQTSNPTPESKAPDVHVPEPSSSRTVNVHTEDATRQKEFRVGIEAFVSPHLRGFDGILKQRYTDFLVNEILPGGEVCHLKTLGDEAVRQREKQLLRERDQEWQAKEDEYQKQQAEKREKEQQKKQEEEQKQKEEEQQEKASGAAEGGQDGSGSLQENEKTGEEQAVVNDLEQTNVMDVDQKQTPSDANGQQHNQGQGKTDSEEVSEENIARLNDLFGERTGAILRLYNNVLKHPEWKARDFSAVKTPKMDDRARRTGAHQAIREIFSSRLESMTENDGSITVQAMPPNARGMGGYHQSGRGGLGRGSRQGERQQKPDHHRPKPRGKLGWAELGGEYLHFTLYKENKDTMESVSWLAFQNKVPAKAFQFAGTKDRRGVTTQRVCVKRVFADQLSRTGRTLRNAHIGDFEYRTSGLNLGDLEGNEFVIVLRDCQFPDTEGLSHKEKLDVGKTIVSQAIADFSEKGFINYYGLQRFGTFAGTTDEIGVRMLQEDFKGAVDKILEYSPALLDISEHEQGSNPVARDDLARAKALDIFKKTQNSQDALKEMPRKFSAETGLIRHLGSRNHQNDYQGALMTISRNLRMMYTHAYQSLVWNAVASKRWELYGDKVVEGDLVLVNEHREKAADAPMAADDVDQAGEEVVLPAGDDRAVMEDDIHERARALTKDEVESGRYSIFDVVLALPGWDVEYPQNAIGEYYKEFMGSERGGGLDPHKMRRAWKEVSLTGGYRKLLGRPGPGMHGEVKGYVGVDTQLVQTDMERLQAAKRDAPDGKRDEAEQSPAAAEKRIAVIIKMRLSTAMYATMALRELMKAGGMKTYKPEYSGRG